MRGFIAELRYRNVIRVAAAYIIVGWLIVQVADVAVDAFDAPAWVLQILIVFLMLGLPVALFLSWAFELTPEGMKKAHEVPSDAPKDPRSGRVLNTIIMATLVLGIAWLGWDKVQAPTSNVRTIVTDKSIAVLPFADFSPQGDHAWFADGLTDEILNALARTHDLRVASRTSSFAFRDSDQDMPTIAARLDVAHILEGSVRRAGDRIRVTAQLIRANDDAHLWSETFDARSADSIEIQERIAFEIASLLDTAMDPDELAKMVAAGTDSVLAWESYLRMLDLSIRALSEQNTSRNGQILSLYGDIVKADPSFAEAHQLIASNVIYWLDPNDLRQPPPGHSAEALRQVFATSSAAASQYARTDEARLSAEMLSAKMQLRVKDHIDLTRARLELRLNDRSSWYEHFEALFRGSQFEEARALAIRGSEHNFGHDELPTLLFLMTARVDLPRGLAQARRALSLPSPSANVLYQAHRVFLNAGLVEEAAELARRYATIATSAELQLLLKMRQACAEGRVADADALYASHNYVGDDKALDTNNTQWLALKTLGRDEEALEVNRELDEPETLFALAGFLNYTHFDPRPYPNLSAALETQGVQRTNPMELTFACNR